MHSYPVGVLGSPGVLPDYCDSSHYMVLGNSRIELQSILPCSGFVLVYDSVWHICIDWTVKWRRCLSELLIFFWGVLRQNPLGLTVPIDYHVM